MSRTSRLLELITVLRARRTPVTADALARETGVSPRSVYRDIETLRSLGAPLDGQAGVGYVLRAGFFLPELAFTSDEMDALALGLGWVQQRADPGLARSSERALAKVLSARMADPTAGHEPPALIAAATAGQLPDPAQTTVLRDGIRQQRKAVITYKALDGTLSHRTVWPVAIVYFDEVRILAAWCEARGAFRHFRLDRVEAAMLLTDRYPGRRQAILERWMRQDRAWQSVLTVSDAAPR